jgi:hypothetical protein
LEFSAVRNEFRGSLEELRRELREEWRTDLQATADQLRTEINAGDEETRHLMRVLHEELVTRLILIQEGQRANQFDNRSASPSRRRKR